MKEQFSESDALYEMRREARERILGAVEKLKNEDGLDIEVGEDEPDFIVLVLEKLNSRGEKEIYRKGFMKILKMPNGSTIEEEVERQLKFPQEDNKGD